MHILLYYTDYKSLVNNIIMIKKTSLARDFTIFSAAILLSLLVVCLVVGLFAHYSYYKKQDSRIVYEAKILDDALFD